MSFFKKSHVPVFIVINNQIDHHVLLGIDEEGSLGLTLSWTSIVPPVREDQPFFPCVAASVVFPNREAECLLMDGNPGICGSYSRPQVKKEQYLRIFQ